VALLLVLLSPAQARLAAGITYGSVSDAVRNADGHGVGDLRVGVPATGTALRHHRRQRVVPHPERPTSSGPYDVQLLAPCTRDQVKRVVLDDAER
jgi:hypothetical protein